MEQLLYINMMFVLFCDGFYLDSVEGLVGLCGDDILVFDYWMIDYIWDGICCVFYIMVEIQFVVGVWEVWLVYSDVCSVKNLQEVCGIIDGLCLEIYCMCLGSVYVMGGCVMGEDLVVVVVDSFGCYYYLWNLLIYDGLLFFISIGVNLQFLVYGFIV